MFHKVTWGQVFKLPPKSNSYFDINPRVATTTLRWFNGIFISQLRQLAETMPSRRHLAGGTKPACLHQVQSRCICTQCSHVAFTKSNWYYYIQHDFQYDCWWGLSVRPIYFQTRFTLISKTGYALPVKPILWANRQPFSRKDRLR